MLCVRLFFVTCLFAACGKTNKEAVDKSGIPLEIEYAKGFKLTNYPGYKEIVLEKTWPGSTEQRTYLLVPKGKPVPTHKPEALVVRTPIEKIVLMSTTAVPALEYLGVADCLVGFPQTDYISSEKTRQNIAKGKVKDLGSDLGMNMELLLDLEPDLLVGFSVNGKDSQLNQISRYGIPVVLNASWVETHPLGRAEWIKFMAAFFDKDKEAKAIFDEVKENYLAAKELAHKADSRPTVFAGTMYKEIWNVPGGESYVAQMLDDAHADYLWKDTEQAGSLQLNFENVLEKAQHAQIWIDAGSFENRQQMQEMNERYTFFDAYQNGQVYTFSYKKGATGGSLYYELGPLRPDFILKDILWAVHPGLLADYEPYFLTTID